MAAADRTDSPVAVARRLEPSGLGVSEVAERVAQGRVNAAPAPPVRTLSEIIRANVLTWVNAIVGTLFVLVLMAGRPADGLFVGIILSNSVLASRPLAPWKALLAGAMAASYLLMMAIDPLSDYFQLQPALGTLWWTIGVGVAAGGAVIVGIRAVTDRLSRTGLGPVLGGPGRVPGVPPS